MNASVETSRVLWVGLRSETDLNLGDLVRTGRSSPLNPDHSFPFKSFLPRKLIVPSSLRPYLEVLNIEINGVPVFKSKADMDRMKDASDPESPDMWTFDKLGLDVSFDTMENASKQGIVVVARCIAPTKARLRASINGFVVEDPAFDEARAKLNEAIEVAKNEYRCTHYDFAAPYVVGWACHVCLSFNTRKNEKCYACAHVRAECGSTGEDFYPRSPWAIGAAERYIEAIVFNRSDEAKVFSCMMIRKPMTDRERADRWRKK